MNPLLSQIIIRTALKRKASGQNPEHDFTRFELAKGLRKLRITVATLLKDTVLIALGIGSAAFGLKSFLLPNKFIDGGATGIALLTSELTKIPLPYLLIAVNLPFIILGYNIIGRQFALKTVVAILGLALVTGFVHFPDITHDKLLVAVFGGFFLGAGIGLTVRGGAVLDGTEVLAIFLSRKMGVTIGDVIMGVNALIFASVAYFLSIETALYSMITYLSASKTLDFIIEGIEEYTGVTIVSHHSNEIREMIVNEMGRGVTVYRGKRGFGKSGETSDVDIIYTVITRLEISKLNLEIEKCDPNAFVVMNSIKDTKGGMIKKRGFNK
jgi:uncharacterized membrane-anchored protein YitT (DUF2179 family)